MPAWLGMICAAFGWLIKTFLNRKPATVSDAQQLGAAQAQLQEAQSDVSDVSKAVQAANAARAATLDPDSLREPSDPDCRDCKA